MQEQGGEPRAQYYTNDTSLSEADRSSHRAGSPAIELSENVSGDYYVTYTAGESMAAAYVGNSRRLETDDDAFELADEEVGIYTVYEVDSDVREIPDPEATGDVTAAGDAVVVEDEVVDEGTAEDEASGGRNARKTIPPRTTRSMTIRPRRNSRARRTTTAESRHEAYTTAKEETRHRPRPENERASPTSRTNRAKSEGPRIRPRRRLPGNRKQAPRQTPRPGAGRPDGLGAGRPTTEPTTRRHPSQSAIDPTYPTDLIPRRTRCLRRARVRC